MPSLQRIRSRSRRATHFQSGKRSRHLSVGPVFIRPLAPQPSRQSSACSEARRLSMARERVRADLHA